MSEISNGVPKEEEMYKNDRDLMHKNSWKYLRVADQSEDLVRSEEEGRQRSAAAESIQQQTADRKSDSSKGSTTNIIQQYLERRTRNLLKSLESLMSSNEIGELT